MTAADADDRVWSVRLVIDDDAARRLPEHVTVLWNRQLRRVAFGGGGIEEDQPPWLHIDLRESDARSARLLAQYLAGRLYELAGLKVAELPVAWVAPATDGPTSGGSFLEQARELVESEYFELGVVAAQIHLEAQVNELVRAAASREGSPLSRAVVGERRSWPPQDSRARPVIDALLGIELTRFPRWEDYRAHLTRRNAVVHEAQAIREEAADNSLEVVEEFWLWIYEQTSRDGRARTQTEARRPRPSAAATESLFEGFQERRYRSSGSTTYRVDEEDQALRSTASTEPPDDSSA